jgi:transketolase
LPSLKPLDEDAIMSAAAGTRMTITAEEHQVGGLGNRVAGLLLEHLSPSDKVRPFARIGVRDRFGESGEPWQLVKKFGLSAEHIAEKALAIRSKR